MSHMVLIRWRWLVDGPLVTGLSQSVAEAAGLIDPGARTVVNLQTRSNPEQLTPSFLITSVKGVFRSAAAWFLERVAAQQWGLDQYITCDYGQSVPKKWARFRPASQSTLCPACRVFGGAGCLAADEGGAPNLRLKSPVSFTFADGRDAYYSEVTRSGPHRFAWEQAAKKGKDLLIEQLLQPAEGVELVARMEGATAAHQALLLLAGDLISSGFFRFGRFTSRGYGVVRLTPLAHLSMSLHDLLAEEGPNWTMLPEIGTGLEAAGTVLTANPVDLIGRFLEQYRTEGV